MIKTTALLCSALMAANVMAVNPGSHVNCSPVGTTTRQTSSSTVNVTVSQPGNTNSYATTHQKNSSAVNDTVSQPGNINSYATTRQSGNSAEQTQALQPVTTGVPADAKEVEKYDSSAVRNGRNQVDAILVPINTRVCSRVEEGNYAWHSFTTPSVMEGDCTIVAVNKSAEDDRLMLTSVLDQEGNTVLTEDVNWYKELVADYKGMAHASTMTDLEPDTTYFVKVYAEHMKDLNYMLNIMIPVPEEADTKKTTEVLEDALVYVSEDAYEADHTNKNFDDARKINVNETYKGTVLQKNAAWYSFTTGDNPEAEYSFSLTNLTPEGCNIEGFVTDESGNNVLDKKNLNWYGYLSAKNDGTTVSATLIDPKPNTTYYCGVWSEKKNRESLDYAVCINGKNMDLVRDDTEAEDDLQSGSDDTTSQESKEDTIPAEKPNLVLKKPLELTNNQIMFKGGSAEFVNKEDVINVLTPLAKIMKSHSDHSFLLVGTTATAETEEYCLNLSNDRAAAVKSVLVNELGVSEAQIKSIGRGFAKEPFARGEDRDAEGNFIESEGAKNRRVIVLDLEDPIAKGLM